MSASIGDVSIDKNGMVTVQVTLKRQVAYEGRGDADVANAVRETARLALHAFSELSIEKLDELVDRVAPYTPNTENNQSG